MDWIERTRGSYPAGFSSGVLQDPRSVQRFKSGRNGGSSSLDWTPTKLTSPYKVLTAGVLQNDFYANCISWGRESFAVGLTSEILVLLQGKTQFIGQVEELSAGSSGSSRGRNAVRPTTVSVMRRSDSEVLMGLSDGSTMLLEGREDGTFARQRVFEMPPSPLADWLRPPYPSGGFLREEWLRCRELLAQHADTVCSAGCSATSASLPYEVIVGTSSSGLVLLDARCPSPALVLGTRETCGRLADPCDAWEQDDGLLVRTTSSLLQNDRLCSVTWSANGSYVATGGSNGLVTIWSISAPREPLHRILVDPDSAVKAVTFHPSNPYEIAMGGSAGRHGLRLYDVSGTTPRLTHSGATETPTTQMLYSPDGGHLVTAHGSVRSATSRANLHGYLPMPLGLFEPEDGSGAGLVAELGVPEVKKALRIPPFTPVAPPQEGRDAPRTASGSSVSYCLAVWRKGRPSSSRSSFSLRQPEVERSWAGPLPVLPVQTLSGHKDRPLYLATPFAGSAKSGHVASASGGRDKSLRFWKVFQPQDAA